MKKEPTPRSSKYYTKLCKSIAPFADVAWEMLQFCQKLERELRVAKRELKAHKVSLRLYENAEEHRKF